MKKYLIISVCSLVACFFIIFKVYENNDIELIDAIVESTVAGLGIKSEVVEKKIERKIEEKRIEEEKKQLSFVPPVVETPQEEIIEEVPQEEEKPAEVFNLKQESTKKSVVVEKVDSANFNMLAVQEEEEEEEEPAFNVIKASTGTITDGEVVPNHFFQARIHNTQEVINDELIWVRADEPVTIAGQQVPKNTRFQARVNLFQGRLFLVVESINGVKVKLNNYDNALKRGVPIIERYQHGDQIVLSDGEVMKFNTY